MTPKIVPGRPAPLGATCDARGTNFAVASGGDEVRLCLFDADGTEAQLVLPERDGDVWHGFVPGAGPGQAYGFRVNGPIDPGHGSCYNPAKLLLDPYARSIAGDVRFGPEVLGHSRENPLAPSFLDSADHVPRSVVVAAAPPIAVPKTAACACRHHPLRGSCSRVHRDPSRCAEGAAWHICGACSRVVVAAKEIYEFQEFHYAGPCGDNSFLEDYTSSVRGAPLRVIVLVVFNADGKAQRLVVNHRPRSSVLVMSRAMLERFAGTPLAKHWEGTP